MIKAYEESSLPGHCQDGSLSQGGRNHLPPSRHRTRLPDPQLWKLVDTKAKPPEPLRFRASTPLLCSCWPSPVSSALPKAQGSVFTYERRIYPAFMVSFVFSALSCTQSCLNSWIISFLIQPPTIWLHTAKSPSSYTSLCGSVPLGLLHCPMLFPLPEPFFP